MPAGTEDLGALVSLAALPVGKLDMLDGEGVRGVEKGWAAEVDVAAGGFSGRGRRAVAEKARMGWKEEIIRLAQWRQSIVDRERSA